MRGRLRLELPPWVFLLLLGAVVAVVLFGIDSYRHRFVRSNADLVHLLPRGDSTVAFANFSVLRRAGMMGLLAGAKAAEAAEYDQFVSETRFDYEKDIDALAAAVDNGRIFFVARGRFDWDALRSYVKGHGGSCRDAFCRIPTSQPGRWASLVEIQSNVIGLAVGNDASTAQLLRAGRQQRGATIPSAPVWVRVSERLLKNPVELPLPVRIFAITLQSADSVLVSFDAAEADDSAAFEIRLDAACPNGVTASTIRQQLELQTKLLKLELAREHAQPNPADLSGLLTSGSFQVVDRNVIGTWPVRKELLKTLQ
jgi:hypothetical protein